MEQRSRRIIDTLTPRRTVKPDRIVVQVVYAVEENGWKVEERIQPVATLFHPFDPQVARLVMEGERQIQAELDAAATDDVSNPL
jgi:hypothetical protein